MRDIEMIIKTLTEAHPDIVHEQLKVLHPGADDDGLWFFRHHESQFEVQLESPDGECPFLVETDAHHFRATANTAPEAVLMVSQGLGLVPRALQA